LKVETAARKAKLQGERILSEQKKCPKCHSKDFKKQKEVRFMDAGWGVWSYLYADAHICGNCGYIELYKHKPRATTWPNVVGYDFRTKRRTSNHDF